MSTVLFALSQADGLAGGGPSLSGQAFLSVFVVVGIVGAAAWALRRTNAVRRGKLPIAVETAVSLGERRSLVVVSVEGRRLLLGLTPQSVSLVTELKTPPEGFAQALDASLSEPRS